MSVSGKLANGTGQGRDASGWNKQSVATIFNDLRNSPDVRRYPRQPSASLKQCMGILQR